MKHEEDAKLAYYTWLHRVDTMDEIPWEHLTQREREAWDEVIDFALSELIPECDTCDRTLYCLHCSRAEVKAEMKDIAADARRAAAQERRAEARRAKIKVQGAS